MSITPAGTWIVSPPSRKASRAGAKLAARLPAKQRLRNRMWVIVGGANAAMALGNQVSL